MRKQLSCVLLIDDNDDDNFYHRIVLKETGITERIEVAETGYEALKFLQNVQRIPELIFLDINMPRMNGWEFLECYKQLSLEEKDKAIIIMLTTSRNPADEKKAGSMPEVKGFESKPLTFEMVSKIVSEHFAE